MKFILYSDQSASGNAVLLAKAISKASGIGASESLQLAMELFGGKYSFDNAFRLTLSDDFAKNTLAEACNQCGILIKSSSEFRQNNQQETQDG